METFRILLNCVDHYQTIPTHLDPQLPRQDGAVPAPSKPKVPVIRVFGATESGQKVCAHIHGVFPYLYLEYFGDLASEQVKVSIRSLHVSIDHALAVSYRRTEYNSGTAYVAHISLVKGIPFYGYNVGYKFFFKIYLLNPLHITRLADLLLQGAILKRVLQPYESHLQFIPQWLCDYNLYGCSYINCSKVTFRGPVPAFSELEDQRHGWHDQSIPTDLISNVALFPKQSHCSLEVDIQVHDILNRHEVQERTLHLDLFECQNIISPDKKLLPSLASLWEDEKRRRKAANGSADQTVAPFSSADLIPVSADQRSTGAGWVHEEEYKAKIKEIIILEGNKGSLHPNVPSLCFGLNIASALESVEELFPHKLKATFDNLDTTVDELVPEIEVDEARILSLDPEGLSSFNEDANGPDSGVSVLENAEPTEPDPRLLGSQFPQADSPKPYHKDPNYSSTKDLSIAELKAMGVHKLSEAIDSQEDMFEIGYEFISKLKSNSTKRSLFSSTVPQPPKKKSKLTAESYQKDIPSPGRSASNPEHSQPTMSTASNSLPRANLSQKLTRSGNSQKLCFPVVKDPNDPATIMRASQQNSSQKLTCLKLNDSQPPQINIISDIGLPLEGSKSPPNFGIREAFRHRPGKIYFFSSPSPSSSDIQNTINEDSRPTVVYQGAYYSNEEDVPDRPREYGGREFKLESNTVPYLPMFDPTGQSLLPNGPVQTSAFDHDTLESVSNRLRKGCSLRRWEFAPTPPSRSEVVEWCKDQGSKKPPLPPPIIKKTTHVGISQIQATTQQNPHGFKYSLKKLSHNVRRESNYMSVMSLEVHVNSRGTLAPHPEVDEVSCIFWCFQGGDCPPNKASKEGIQVGVLALSAHQKIATKIHRDTDAEIEEESSELDVLTRLVDIVRFYDPDILTGYEVHNSSWGYLIERARVKYDYDLCDELSRVKSDAHGRFGKESDRWGFNHTSTIRVTGRHMINIWRAMRAELTLLQYTLENVAFHLLHRRIPHYSFQELTKWFESNKPRDLVKIVNYFVKRTKLNLDILDANELIPRTSEQARILGIDFFSVFSRGSQFKVESLMFRIAKPENFLLISPSRSQVGQQNALECLPLVMEPQSDFYTSPLLVLDFQSLYPSVMIAYNYCYSTYLGRVVDWRGRNKMGFIDYERQSGLLDKFQDQINVAPNGIMYTKPEVRKSLLAKMLTEILETRVMVKTGMKANKDDKTLQRLLNNRQLALKLIANVTYGYTSASFSGRMPCVEIADSIVQTARETLERAIAKIHSIKRWDAEVVYGDTDSLFIYLKGRSRDEAFDIGEEIARTITDSNPRPVKLKFEKVYHPCILLAKKRYVGYKYETRSQSKPEFDAKGIETVRRDGTPAEQKIEEKALKVLFETADLSRVKRYFQKQCSKIMQGRVSIQDFCFAKEVKLGTYSEKGAPPPGALISAKRMLEDPRLEPQYGERVPYVVVSGAPGARLIDRCVAPEYLLRDPHMELDAEYYISKNLIPPLERIFNLVGANVRQWYDEMPKYQRMRRTDGAIIPSGKDGTLSRRTLEAYMKSSSCAVCREKADSEQRVCSRCLQQPQIALMRLRYRAQQTAEKAAGLHDICRSCMEVPWGDDVKCDSKDCPVFYSRTRATANLGHTQSLLDPIADLLGDQSENGPLSW
ncbi:DNA polymerase zeta [Ophidiomyces ophidiicola]|nr:DNA polymerase zeta [Ophidiomyces ophidiicola]